MKFILSPWPRCKHCHRPRENHLMRVFHCLDLQGVPHETQRYEPENLAVAQLIARREVREVYLRHLREQVSD